MIRKLQAIFNPEQFQGWYQRKSYFEGWYYKIVNSTEQYAFAFIPGINMDKEGNQNAFIQVLDGKKNESEYHKFKYDSFIARPGKFQISIQDNHFTANYLQLNLPGIQGRLDFKDNVPWPTPLYAPGIMGPYTFVPFMECYHGIVSMDHRIMGSLIFKDKHISFDYGRGYIEKDWGRSFPTAYFWLQSNHFSHTGISIKASVARIPWLRGQFTGFICGLWLKDRLIRFTTYNRTKLIKSFASREKIELIMRNKKYEICITAFRDQATSLASPILGTMEGRIEESMKASIGVRLTDVVNKKLIFEDTGRNAGLEVAGNIQEIFVGNAIEDL